jgi:hypothetical protein
METEKPYAVMETLFGYMADNGILAEALAKQEAPTLRKWIREIAEEVGKAPEEKPNSGPPGSPPPNENKKEPPKSVVASAGKDGGETPSLDSRNASIEDVIRHVRKYGDKGIK